MKCTRLFLVGVLAGMSCVALRAEVKMYPVPRPLYYSMHNDDFTVQVRSAGEKTWTDLFEYTCKMDMDTQSDASFVQFDFEGKVEVRVQKNNGELRSALIRPLSKGIVPKIEGNVMTFTLDRPEDLSLECNGDRLHNLHIFTNPIETSRPKKGDDGVMYFEAGLHEVDGDTLSVPSNTLLYMEPGAVLKGKLVCDSVENVKILGRGFLLEPQQGVSIAFSKNVTIDGLTIINPRHYSVSGGQSEGITVRNLRSFSNKGWSDGIDMMCCRDVLVDKVFMRNSDDCIALYNHRWQFYGGSRNITIQNSTLWADIAHPVNMGGHGNPDAEPGEVMEDVVLRNIDILEHDEDDPPYQGCIAIDAGDRNLVRNVLCEDIRVESIQEGCLFYVKVRFNEKYDKQPGRGIRNITFRNITYTGLNDSPLILEGLDEERKISNVTFENVRINGVRLGGLQRFRTNRFVEGVSFK